jgi:tetratricopeptide (TPR) repeat protein
VQAVIQARLAQLSESAKEIVGIAATIGRAFTVDLLANASRRSDEALIGSLDELWRRRIIREQGADSYDFTHDKLREVAYGRLSPMRRRQYHREVARALQEAYTDDPAPVSGQIAVHFEQSGDGDQAAVWYMHAAETAQHMHAHSEAVRLLQRGVDLLRALPKTRDRQLQELAMLTALLGPLVAIGGYQSADSARIQEQALSLTRALGVDPTPPLLWSLAVANLVRGDLATARTYGELLQARGERDDDDVLVAQSDYVLGISAFWYAEFSSARSHFEAAIARFKPADLSAHLLRYGNDPAIVCQMRLAFVLWFLGRTAEARRLRDEAFAQALSHEDWFTRMGVLHFAGLLSIEIGDHDRIRDCVSALDEISVAHSTAFVSHNGEALAGYVDVLDGRHEDGIQRIHRALDDLRESIQLPGQRASVARVLLAARSVIAEPRAGLIAADRLLNAGVGSRIWEAEALRARAEFTAALDAGSTSVEEDLALALDIARQQQAAALELRVATSLLHHRLTTGTPRSIHTARTLLAGLVESVSDGSDNHDLRVVAALLASR